MALTKEEKTEVKKSWQKSQNDAGGTALQIALLTKEIQKMTAHFKTHKHDNNSKRGLFLKLSHRKKLMKYLQRRDKPAYEKLVAVLDI